MCGNDNKPLGNNYGEPIKYDPNFRGPLRKRSCTDIICFQLFIIFMLCWVVIGVFALCKGDSDLFSIPRDSQNRKCGYDTDVRDKPYLFFIDMTKCADKTFFLTGCKTKEVCVKKCPDIIYKYTDGLDKAICADDLIPTNQKQLEDYVNSGTCAKWYLPSVSVAHRCIPEISKMTQEIKNIIEYEKFEQGLKNCEFFIKKEKIFPLMFDYVKEYWWQIVLFLLGAIIVCFLYIILMRWIGGVLACLLILGFLAALAYGIYECDTRHKQAVDSKKKVKWLVLLILCSVTLGLTLLILLCLRKRISVAIALIQEGSKAVAAVPSTLLFPIFPLILQVLLVAFGLTICIYLMYIRNITYKVEASDNCVCPSYKAGDKCNPDQFTIDCAQVLESKCNIRCSMHKNEIPTYIYIFHAVNVLGTFWSLSFISDLGDIILALCFSTWYWTFNKKDIPFCTLLSSISMAFRYHPGTAAFGSLFIAICRIIHAIICVINHILKKCSCGILHILFCCKCFGWCLEKCLGFINTNAYIMCAIHGKNFCKSAKHAFHLLMRNILRVAVVDCVTDLLLFLGKIFITAGLAFLAYWVVGNYSGNMEDDEDSYYTIGPVALVAIGTFMISSVFFKVYGMAVDTLFLCFLEDCERNDGSETKPYYMSKGLMKILKKKKRGN